MRSFRRNWVTMLVRGTLFSWFRSRPKVDDKTLNRMEFSTSGQRMGLRFTRRLRDFWRQRWIKLRK